MAGSIDDPDPVKVSEPYSFVLMVYVESFFGTHGRRSYLLRSVNAVNQGA